MDAEALANAILDHLIATAHKLPTSNGYVNVRDEIYDPEADVSTRAKRGESVILDGEWNLIELAETILRLTK